jgi:hypothetical protein
MTRSQLGTLLVKLLLTGGFEFHQLFFASCLLSREDLQAHLDPSFCIQPRKLRRQGRHSGFVDSRVDIDEGLTLPD